MAYMWSILSIRSKPNVIWDMFDIYLYLVKLSQLGSSLEKYVKLDYMLVRCTEKAETASTVTPGVAACNRGCKSQDSLLLPIRTTGEANHRIPCSSTLMEQQG